jgi:hypothetical protein
MFHAKRTRQAVHRRAATRNILGKPGLILLTLAAVTVLGGILMGTASATSQDMGARQAAPSPSTTGLPELPVQATQTTQATQIPYQPALIPTQAVVHLLLKPAEAVIGAGERRGYTARLLVRVDRHQTSIDVTRWTRFAIDRDGSCKKVRGKVSCSATNIGPHTVIGILPPDTLPLVSYQIRGTAVLHVTPPVDHLKLEPAEATIELGESQSYTARAVARDGTEQEEVTTQTVFSVSQAGRPSGACTEASCTPTKVGDHTVTGRLTLGHRTVAGTATLTVTPPVTAPPVTPPPVTPPPVTPPPVTLARLELRPASTSIVAGTRQAYAVEGFADDGTSIGNFTTATSFSIRPDGACDGAICSATTAGMHIVTGTVTQGGRRISGLAELQVRHRQPAISSVTPDFTFPGMAVEVGGHTGSCARAGTLTFHGMTADASVKVTADQQGNFVARVTIPRGTFPRAYKLELTVDCNGQLQRAEGELSVGNLAPVAADDSAKTTQDTPVPIVVTANDRNPDPDTGYPTRVLESSPPTHGTTEVRSDQTLVYTPEKGFVGQDQFRYGFCDDIINAAGRADCGTATVTVTVTDAKGCLPSPGNTPSIKVNPSKGPGGVTLGITATVDRKLAACPFRLLLGGAPLGPDVRVGPDGSISAERGVPNDAKPGPSPVRLATMSGQTLAETSFQIVPPGLSLLLKLIIAAGALLAGALARAALRRWRPSQEERDRRKLGQVPEDIRAEPHTSPVDATVEPDRDETRTFTVRLEPHHDPGNQTMQEATR